MTAATEISAPYTTEARKNSWANRQSSHPRSSATDSYHIPGKLDHGCQRLENQEVGDGTQTHDAVPRVQQHVSMPAQRLEGPALPAVALPGERVDPFGHLGPADRIGPEHDAVLLATIAEVPVHTDDDLHVFADGAGAESADGNQCVTPEQSEGPRDDQQSVHHRLRDASCKERAEVFGHLEARQVARRKADTDDPPVIVRGTRSRCG